VTLKWEQQTPSVEELGEKPASAREYPAAGLELRRNQA
jgi:hypothetical protein